jgi:hypothetical protein
MKGPKPFYVIIKAGRFLGVPSMNATKGFRINIELEFPQEDQWLQTRLSQALGIAPDNIQIYHADHEQSLWQAATQGFSAEQAERYHSLKKQAKSGSLGLGEQAEFEELLEVLKVQLLQRSQALIELKKRGYDIENWMDAHYKLMDISHNAT